VIDGDPCVSGSVVESGSFLAPKKRNCRRRAQVLAGVEIGESYGQRKRFVLFGVIEGRFCGRRVFVDGEVGEGYACGGFSERLERVVLGWTPKPYS